MTKRANRAGDLELWGGLECTVNRVGEQYYDQMHRNGHAERATDLDLFAGLGIKAVRYPVLWERHHAVSGGIDWSWADDRLGRLRDHGVRPIVGLVHHGSGPAHTSLVDPSFPEGVAQFAGRVARRFPWVRDWTPVNEPLTTARFSGMYGLWYPHGRDACMFARALVTQCRAVAMAMAAIRAVNPHARLIQTDDLGKTYSTRALAYQADFENERRWLTWDLLTGLVDRYHPMWRHLRDCEVPETDLAWFLDHPCPPDVIGVNHYVTSERYLDEHVERYPESARGGNGRHIYADVEAVRVLAFGIGGPERMLREAWERYHRPLAVTEAHLGCTREEQMRWLVEVWAAARAARKAGAQVEAVTAWALLGSYDWDSLLTRFEGHYEPGVFDLRAPAPRPTGIARVMRELAAGKEPTHPVLAVPGWWRQPQRVLYPQADVHPKVALMAGFTQTVGRLAPRPLLLLGGSRAAAASTERICVARNLAFRAITHGPLEEMDAAQLGEMLERMRPWGVICPPESAGAQAAPGYESRLTAIAAGCARLGIELVAFSSPAVFAGMPGGPHSEDTPPGPATADGRQALARERAVYHAMPSALIIRPGALFGVPGGALTEALHALERGDEYVAHGGAARSLAYLPDLIHAALDLLMDGEAGLWHLAHPGATAWSEIIQWTAQQLGIPAGTLREGEPGEVIMRDAVRLTSARGSVMPPLGEALARYVADVGHRIVSGGERSDVTAQRPAPARRE